MVEDFITCFILGVVAIIVGVACIRYPKTKESSQFQFEGPGPGLTYRQRLIALGILILAGGIWILGYIVYYFFW